MENMRRHGPFVYRFEDAALSRRQDRFDSGTGTEEQNVAKPGIALVGDQEIGRFKSGRSDWK